MAKQQDVRFIRKNGRVIPIRSGGKVNTYGKGQSKETVQKRLKALKRVDRNKPSPFKQAAISGTVLGGIFGLAFGVNKSKYTGLAIAAGATAGAIGGAKRTIQGNKKRKKKIKGLKKQLKYGY